LPIKKQEIEMAYDLTGKIKVIQEAKTYGAKGFTKREFVVTVAEGKYPQDIALEFVQDNVKLLDGLTAGQTVTVTFDIRGREYNGRYFNNLQAWRIKTGEGEQPADDEGPPAFTDIDKAPSTDDGDTPF
jgi:single-strand DNA-binding protein